MHEVKRRVKEKSFARCIYEESDNFVRHDSTTRLPSCFDVLWSVFFPQRLLLYFHVRSLECRDDTLETESTVNEFISQSGHE